VFVCTRVRQVWLRAWRNTLGTGRLYRIMYIAGNDAGSCKGVVYVCVPHDASAFEPVDAKAMLASMNATAGMDGPARGAALQAAIAKRAAKIGCPSLDSISDEQWMPTQQEEPAPGERCAHEAVKQKGKMNKP
jgi:hypothetical protein